MAGGNKMFPAGRAGWEELVLGQDPRPGPCRRHLASRPRGWAPDPAPGAFGVPQGVRGGSAPAPWDVVSPGLGSLAVPHIAAGSRASPVPAGGQRRPHSGPLCDGGSSFPGLCSGCLWGFSLLPVLRRLSSLLRERVIPRARPAAPASLHRRIFNRRPPLLVAWGGGSGALPLSGARSPR